MASLALSDNHWAPGVMLTPATEEEAAARVAEAAARGTPLSITGGGSKLGLGRPTQTQASLSSAALTGITLHEPAELVIAARAGTPLAEIERALADKGQRLPFEPLDYRALLGTSGEPTIGGMAAANICGPRRIQVGACRDSFLGARFVNGRGEIIKSGGRVMKNVTGLDLTRLMAGSFGTLGFLTEVTFKTLPVPETQASLVIRGLADERAIEALSAALGSPYEVTGAAHLPAGIGAGEARTAARLEGLAATVDHRCQALNATLKPFGAAECLDEQASAVLWRDIRDATFLSEPRDLAIWRISVPPTKAAPLTEAVGRQREARWFYDWGGGLIWLARAAEGDAGAPVIHEAARVAGGHATLIRAPGAVRAAVAIFQPRSDALLTLTRAVKASFDPAGIFEPGRMYPGV
jgi:glycolate oxidase FAD binding subunit